MMLKTILVLFLILPCLASAQSAQSQPIELKPITDMGLLVARTYDGVIPYPGFENPLSWTVTITPTYGPSLYSGMEWNLVNLKTGKTLLPTWQPIELPSKNSARFTLSQHPALYELLPAACDYKIVISPNKKDEAYFLNVKTLFSTYPARFYDVTDPKNKRCAVDSSKLPNLDRECADYREEIKDLDLSCEQSKKLFEEARICGTWVCNH